MFIRNNSLPYEELDLMGYRVQFFDDNIDHTLVDVRTTGEFMRGHLPGAINIPLSQVNDRMSEIPKDKPVVLVCASGNRSGTAAFKLVQNEYECVYNLMGGTMMWMMYGLPLEQGNQ